MTEFKLKLWANIIQHVEWMDPIILTWTGRRCLRTQEGCRWPAAQSPGRWRCSPLPTDLPDRRLPSAWSLPRCPVWGLRGTASRGVSARQASDTFLYKASAYFHNYTFRVYSTRPSGKCFPPWEQRSEFMTEGAAGLVDVPMSLILLSSSEGVMTSELWPWPSTMRSSSKDKPERVITVEGKSCWLEQRGKRISI